MHTFIHPSITMSIVMSVSQGGEYRVYLTICWCIGQAGTVYRQGGTMHRSSRQEMCTSGTASAYVHQDSNCGAGCPPMPFTTPPTLPFTTPAFHCPPMSAFHCPPMSAFHCPSMNVTARPCLYPSRATVHVCIRLHAYIYIKHNCCEIYYYNPIITPLSHRQHYNYYQVSKADRRFYILLNWRQLISLSSDRKYIFSSKKKRRQLILKEKLLHILKLLFRRFQGAITPTPTSTPTQQTPHHSLRSHILNFLVKTCTSIFSECLL